MFNIGGAELLVILLVALLVLGPNKLPQAARQVGHFLGEFRRIADGFQQELKTAMDDPSMTAPPKADKPKSPGGPTEQPVVIDADSTELADTNGVADGTAAADSGGTADGTDIADSNANAGSNGIADSRPATDGGTGEGKTADAGSTSEPDLPPER